MAEQESAEKNVLATYRLNAKGLIADVIIRDKGGFVNEYEVSMQGIGNATKVLLTSLRPELLSIVPIDPSRVDDKEYEAELILKYTDASNLVINKYLPGTTEAVRKMLVAFIINMLLGLGELEVPLSDENLEEVAINGSRDMLWVFHRQYGWCKTNIALKDEEEIYDYSEQIGRKVGRQISNLNPLMDAELLDGSRVNATLYPISQAGNTITIRKFSKNPWSMVALVANKTLSLEMAALTWLCVQNEISLLISGGTASGKTSFLNALGIFMPANRRVISVEETRELTLPDFLQWLPMLTRQPNPEGKGEVTLYNLMINALRQRPDILLVGEIRTKEDAQTLFEAIHTGHAVYGTLHADNASNTIVRMSNPPINISKLILNALGGIVNLFRHRRLGVRRLLEFGEMLGSGDISVIERWDINNDSFVKIGDMTRLADTIGLYSGFTRQEISQDIVEKGEILNWMVTNKVSMVDDAGYVVANYYKNPSKILQAVKDNAAFSKKMFG